MVISWLCCSQAVWCASISHSRQYFYLESFLSRSVNYLDFDNLRNQGHKFGNHFKPFFDTRTRKLLTRRYCFFFFLILVRFKFDWRHHFFFPASEHLNFAFCFNFARGMFFTWGICRERRHSTLCKVDAQWAYNKYGSLKSPAPAKFVFSRI